MSNIEEANKFKALGNESFTKKDYDEAIKHFTKAIELNPNDHVFYSNRSACYASLGKFEEALEDATKCVNIKPDWAKGYTRKGLAEYYLALYDEAEATYKKGLELEPSNAQFTEGLQKVQEAKKEEAGGSFPDLGGLGGQNQFYQQILMKLLTNPETSGYLQDPEFVKKLTDLQKNPANFAQHLSDPKMKKAFDVIMKDFGAGGMPNMPNFGGNAGASTQQPKKEEKMDEEKPKQEFKPEPKAEPKAQPKAEPKSTSQAEEEKTRGNEEYKKRNFEQAIIHYDKAIELDPHEVIYYNNKAACYIETKQPEKAIEICDKAIEICKGSNYDYVKLAKVLARKASAYVQLEKYDQALQWYSQSLLENNDPKVKDEVKKIEKLKKEQEMKNYINPEISEQHRLKGNELYGQGKYPDAIKEYEEAIRRNPGDARLYANKGTALMKLMEYPSALKDIEKCLELDPTYVKAWAKKGVIHFQMKEYHKSVEAYEKGLKVDPENDECKKGLEKTKMTIMMGNVGESPEEQEERLRHAMADPEIQAILRDPQITTILRNLQEKPNDPHFLAALRDPDVASKINKLVAAGVLRMG